MAYSPMCAVTHHRPEWGGEGKSLESELLPRMNGPECEAQQQSMAQACAYRDPGSRGVKKQTSMTQHNITIIPIFPESRTCRLLMADQ